MGWAGAARGRGTEGTGHLCSVLGLGAAWGSVHRREPRMAMPHSPSPTGARVGCASCSPRPWQMLGMHPTITMWIRQKLEPPGCQRWMWAPAEH